MKIVCLNGSPRKNGNSTALSNAFTAKAKDMGAQVTTYYLNTMNFKGCQACKGCKTKQDSCILKDDLTPVLEDIRDAQALVVATPVYFADVTSQTNQFIHRSYSFYVPYFIPNPAPSRLEKGKRLVFIQTQAQENPDMFNDIYPKYDFFFQFLGFDPGIFVRACGVSEPGDAENDSIRMEEARQAAAAIMDKATTL